MNNVSRQTGRAVLAAAGPLVWNIAANPSLRLRIKRNSLDQDRGARFTDSSQFRQPELAGWSGGVDGMRPAAGIFAVDRHRLPASGDWNDHLAPC